MKRLAVLAAVCAVFSAAVTFAGVQDFGKFTVDVPANWTATHDGDTVSIVKNDNSASLSISYDSLDGASLKEIADAFVKALNGNGLKDENGTYTFGLTNENGVESKCYLSGDSKNYALIVVTGGENAPNEVGAMMGSLKEKSTAAKHSEILGKFRRDSGLSIFVDRPKT